MLLSSSQEGFQADGRRTPACPCIREALPGMGSSTAYVAPGIHSPPAQPHSPLTRINNHEFRHTENVLSGRKTEASAQHHTTSEVIPILLMMKQRDKPLIRSQAGTRQLDSVRFPLAPELCRVSWLGTLGPWDPRTPPHPPHPSLGCCAPQEASLKCLSQKTPELLSSGFQHIGGTYHICLKPFHVSLALRKWEAIYLPREPRG